MLHLMLQLSGLNTQLKPDGDQTVLEFFPLTTVAALKYQGLATIFLRPPCPYNHYFSAMCKLLDVPDYTCNVAAVLLHQVTNGLSAYGYSPP